MWVGAMLLSLVVIPLYSVAVFQNMKLLRVYHDGGMVAILSLCGVHWLATLVGHRPRQGRPNLEAHPMDARQAGLAGLDCGDYFECLVHLDHSGYRICLPGLWWYRCSSHDGRAGCADTFFDVALVVHAVKTRRTE
jgi:hypothetical protein